jgi:hypothetical protein
MENRCAFKRIKSLPFLSTVIQRLLSLHLLNLVLPGRGQYFGRMLRGKAFNVNPS